MPRALNEPVKFTMPTIWRTWGKSGVYKITVDWKYFYFGSSKNLYKRAFQWRRTVNTFTKMSKRMMSIVTDRSLVDMAILEYCDKDVLVLREQFYIQNSFNNPFCLNCCHPLKTIPRQPYKKKLKKPITYHKGFKIPDEEHDNLMAAVAKRREAGVLNACKRIPILQLSLGGKVIREFESLMQAERELGIPNANISSVINGKRNKAGGFIFRVAKQKI